MSYISAVRKGDLVYVWERDSDGRRIIDYPAPYYFYVDDEHGPYLTIYDTAVSRINLDTNKQYNEAKKRFEKEGIRTWESDMPPEIRVLSNHYYGVPAPKLNITFLDIEVDYDPQRGFSSPKNPYAPINSVALLHYNKNEMVVLAVPPEEGWTVDRLKLELTEICKTAPVPAKYTTRVQLYESERELLLALIEELDWCDLACGWNSDMFDFPYIAMRILKVLDQVDVDLTVETEVHPETLKVKLKYTNDPNAKIAGKDKARFLKKLDFHTYGGIGFKPVATKQNKLMGHSITSIGRLFSDYLPLYKKYEPGERASYKLAAISDIVLVDPDTDESILPKLEYEGSLADLYRTNFAFFVRYNMRDTEILGGFEDKLGYVELANQMMHMSTALYAHVGGTLKLAEYALVNYCHHTLKRVVNNNNRPEIDRAIDGALVLLPQTGIHRWIGSIDINSLYPSAIRSINISPETIIGQFVNAASDAAEIAANSSRMITFIRESDKAEMTQPARVWRQELLDNCWAVSGYGTVFNQAKQGFIPSILADWYARRKEYQKKKSDSQKLVNALVKEAGNMDCMTPDNRVLYMKYTEEVGYYDRLQYVYKIKLNSLYGALTNLYFRFYDLRMGESTTGTGRTIVKHQCRKAAEVLDGSYDVDFPLYQSVTDAVESGYTIEEAQQVSLNGAVISGRWYDTKFNGEFQCESVVYGDTDSSYFVTHASNQEEAIAIADHVADRVNASYPEFMRNTFLCNTGYDTLIKCGREIVSDSGIFVEKKRYILHVVDLEGKSVDKMKVMGLDTKKTTLPSYVASRLNKFIERFLKGEEWLDVARSVVEYKDELKTVSDITYIGLPKGVNKLEEYTAAYEADPATRLPGHVAAAICYNNELQERGDLYSPPILSGMKIKQYILKTKLGRFTRIALPTDIEVIPPWFKDFDIDRDVHVQKLVDDPLNNILKAIGKEPPTKQSVFNDTYLSFD